MNLNGERTEFNQDARGEYFRPDKDLNFTDLTGPSEYFAVRLRGYLRRRSHTRKDKLYKVMLQQDMSEGNGKLFQAFKDDKHVKRAKRGGKYALLTVPIATAIDKRQFLKYYCDKQYSAMQAIHTYIGKD